MISERPSEGFGPSSFCSPASPSSHLVRRWDPCTEAKPQPPPSCCQRLCEQGRSCCPPWWRRARGKPFCRSLCSLAALNRCRDPQGHLPGTTASLSLAPGRGNTDDGGGRILPPHPGYLLCLQKSSEMGIICAHSMSKCPSLAGRVYGKNPHVKLLQC